MASITNTAALSAARQAGFTGNDAITIVAIANAESSLNPFAVHRNTNGTVDRGLFQINSVHTNVSESCAFNPICAAKAAYRIWKSEGWKAWTTFRSGAYQKYMPAVATAASKAPGMGPVTIPTPGDVAGAAGNAAGGVLGGIGDAIGGSILNPANAVNAVADAGRRTVPYLVIIGAILLVGIGIVIELQGTKAGQAAKKAGAVAAVA